MLRNSNDDVFTHYEFLNVAWDMVLIVDFKQDFAALRLNYKDM